jgi:hypothetical protein
VTKESPFNGNDTAAIGPSPERERVVPFRGREVTVSPLRIRQLPSFVGALKPVLKELASAAGKADALKDVTVSTDTVLDWIERYTENIIAGVAAATGLDREHVAAAEPDEFLELTIAVFAVNADFFVRRLLPVVGRALQKDEPNATGSGPTHSKG